MTNQSDSNKSDETMDRESIRFDMRVLLLWTAGLGAIIAVSAMVIVSVFF